jgi:hypothetical protein
MINLHKAWWTFYEGYKCLLGCFMVVFAVYKILGSLLYKEGVVDLFLNTIYW